MYAIMYAALLSLQLMASLGSIYAVSWYWRCLVPALVLSSLRHYGDKVIGLQGADNT